MHHLYNFTNNKDVKANADQFLTHLLEISR